MARIFGISVGNDTVNVDAQRRGEIAYTVTNTTARPVRGRMKVVPLGSTSGAWLKIAGESERDFQANGTHQVTVQMEVPPDAQPGTYTFRLDAVLTTNPEEDFTEGPVVAFAVHAVPEQKPAAFPWWIVVAAVMLLIAGTVAGYLLFRKVEVADVHGKPIAQARTMLEKFKVATSERISGDHAPAQGTVLEQDPQAGTRLKRGSVVKLIIEGKPVLRPQRVVPKLPDLHGRLESVARRQLESACQPQPCVSIAVSPEMSGSVGSGEVVRTVPAAGSPLQSGERVILYVNGLVWTRSFSFGGLPQPGTRQTGDTRNVIQAVDLETGNTGDQANQETDLILDGVTRELRSGEGLSSARFLAFGTKTNPDWCLKLEPTVSAFNRIALESVSQGLCACVKTSEGHLSEINISEVESDRLAIWYKIWLPMPPSQ